MKVLVVAGASGGHIFPAMSFLDKLKATEPGSRAILVLPQCGIGSQIEFSGIEVDFIPVSAIRARLDRKNIRAILGFLKGCLKSIKILYRFKPDVVVGFGSLVSIPVVFLGWFLRIPTLVHEQNVIPGSANMFLAHFVDKIAVSFEESRPYLSGCSRKLLVTGNFLRSSLKRTDKSQALDYLGLLPDKFTILVMGGSQGAFRINSEFIKALQLLKVRSGLQVIHLAGTKDFQSLESDYRELGIKAKVFSFLKEMQYAYSCADLAISRSGAGSITELAFFKLPAILIPYPYAHRHQAANAEVLSKRGAALVLEEEGLNAEKFKNELEGLLVHPEKLGAMRDSFSGFIDPEKSVLSLVREAVGLTYNE